MICSPSRAVAWTRGTPLLLQIALNHNTLYLFDSVTTELCASQMAVSKQFESQSVPKQPLRNAQQSSAHSLLRNHTHTYMAEWTVALAVLVLAHLQCWLDCDVARHVPS